MNKTDELLLEAISLLAEGRQFSGQITYSVRGMQHNRRVLEFMARNQSTYIELQAKKAAEDEQGIQELLPEEIRNCGSS